MRRGAITWWAKEIKQKERQLGGRGYGETKIKKGVLPVYGGIYMK